MVAFKKINELVYLVGGRSDTTRSIRECDVMLFCHDVDRGVTLEGRAYSALLDSTRESLELSGIRCVSVAHPWSQLTGEKGYGAPIAMNRLYFFSLLLKKFSKIFRFNLTFNPYEGLIKKASPKFIITIGCSDDLCEAARKLDVFHAELLHGIGYTFVPWEWDKKETRHLPQAIISLDEVSTKAFSALYRHNIFIKQVAHPFFKKFLGSEFAILPKEWALADIKNKKEILVTMQWGYAPHIEGADSGVLALSNGLFYAELEEVVKQTRESIFWRFRFHPVQYRQKEKYSELFDFMDVFVRNNDNCEWKDSTYKPLPSLLLRCDGHITMSSMVSYEAAYFGVQTIALCPTLRGDGQYADYFEDLVESEYLKKIEVSVKEVYTWAVSVGKKQPMVADLFDSDDLSSWVALKARNS